MSTESLLFGLSITCPTVLLWLSHKMLEKQLKNLEQEHLHLSDRFTKLSRSVDDLSVKANHAVDILNKNAKRFSIPYFKR